jgi:hypothetical protein
MMKSLVEGYRDIVRMLEALARNRMLREGQLETSIFLDDTLLRIKLWAADVHLDQGSLDWVDRILQISYRLRERLRRLKQYLDVITMIFSLYMGPYTDEAELSALNGIISKDLDVSLRGLTRAVADLLDLATEIKTADLVPQSIRTPKETDRMNQSMIGPRRPMISARLHCIPFREPLPIDQASPLLGSIISVEGLAAADAHTIAGVRVLNKLNIQVEKKILGTENTDAVSESLVTSTKLGVAATLNPENESDISRQHASIIEWELMNPRNHLGNVFRHHRHISQAYQGGYPITLVTTLLVTQTPVAQMSTIDRRTGTAGSAFPVDHVELVLAVRYMTVEYDAPMSSRHTEIRASSAEHSEYVFVPKLDLPAPPDGPLQLGSILTEWSRPKYPINNAADLYIPAEEIHRSFTPGVCFSYPDTTTGILKTFVKTISSLAPAKRPSETVYKFDWLETVWFLPTSKYLSTAMEQPIVKSYLDASFLRQRLVYLVTGLKIARAAAVQSRGEWSYGTHKSQLSMSDVAIGAEWPASATPATESQRAEGSADFLVGYSLIECKIRRGRSTPTTSTFGRRDRALF